MTTYRKSEALIGLMLILILSYFGLFFVDVQHVIYAIFVPIYFIHGTKQHDRKSVRNSKHYNNRHSKLFKLFLIKYNQLLVLFTDINSGVWNIRYN